MKFGKVVLGGHDQYENLTNYKNSGELILSTQKKADKLELQLVLQSKSLDTIVNMAKNREKMFASIPSIKPVRSDKLPRHLQLLSGFGMRPHPIHKVMKMHAGMDFTAPKGTPIQATGDGEVVRVKRDKVGYGKSVIIDHGYGYTTLYAHMQDIQVRVGEKVKKGQQIGTVGNSGTSTAPHCHYEVRKNGNAVDPINFCMDGLSPEEYQELVEMAATGNQSFD